MSLNKFEDILNSCKTIGLAAHKDPDWDAIYSVLALYEALSRKYDAIFTSNDDCDIKGGAINVDLLISLDCSNIDRISLPEGSRYNKLVNIDHHISNTSFGDLNILETCSSTCEILFYLLKDLGFKIDEKIAGYLYRGILSDTGHFAWGISEKTMLALSELVTLVDTEKISKEFNALSEQSARVLGYALSNYELKDGVLSVNLPANILKTIDHGVSNFLKRIDSKIVVVFKEAAGKVSLRSEEIDVSKVAAHFDGGGHKKAAGFSTDLKYDELLLKIRSLI